MMERGTMDFSLFFFADDSTSAPADGDKGRYGLLLDAARFADAHGFTAVWTPERHFHPFGGLYPSPAVTGAAIAAVTERIGVRAGSVVAPLGDPLRIAEEWSVVDNLSGGRAGVSFASGWHPNDFVLAPENYADRRAILRKTVEEVRALWRGETLSRTGGRGDALEVRIFPPPVRAAIPVWLTSAGSVETFQAAGELGAGMLTHLVRQDFDGLAENIKLYREAFEAGPGQGPGHVAIMLHTFVGPDEDDIRELVRAPMKDYLASSLGLFAGASKKGAPQISESRREQLLDLAFDRYFESGALFGTVERACEQAKRLRAVGVDEIACLIDFGAPRERVLEGLEQLDMVRKLSTDKEIS